MAVILPRGSLAHQEQEDLGRQVDPDSVRQGPEEILTRAFPVAA
ncbi:hypothetical protein ACFC58_27165 [Kitasatospora purpeofusca]